MKNVNENKYWNKKEQDEPVENTAEVSSQESTQDKYCNCGDKKCNGKSCR